MKAISDTEFCEIIKSACPYDHGCSVCRLNNDYETALQKSRKLVEKLEGSKG